MDNNSTPNHNQDVPNELRFGNHFMNDSGVENCSFLQNEAMCSAKPPRILLNDIPIDMTINRTLFDDENQTAAALDENIMNATASSGLGSMVVNGDSSVVDSTVAQSTEAEQSANSHGPTEAETSSRHASKYSIENDVIVIDSDDEVDSFTNTNNLNRFLVNYKPIISEARLKALHDISMEVIDADKRTSTKRIMSLFSDMPSLGHARSTDLNNDTDVIDLSEDDDLFNNTLERVDNILGENAPTISEARLKVLHDISMEVVDVERRKSPKRTMSLFNESPESIAELRRQRPAKRTISVEQFF